MRCRLAFFILMAENERLGGVEFNERELGRAGEPEVTDLASRAPLVGGIGPRAAVFTVVESMIYLTIRLLETGCGRGRNCMTKRS
jgi:hypothetical protein